MSDYFLNGIKRDGSERMLCGASKLGTLDEVTKMARRRVDSGEFERVEVCEWTHRVVKVVSA